MAFFSRKSSAVFLVEKNAATDFFSWQMSATKFTLVTSALFVVFYNTAFFKALHSALPITNIKSALFFASVSLLVGVATALVLSLIVLPKIAKPIMAFLFVSAAKP
jgi:glucan phosphoethanolaminetransferase (alkaline phosphatase superfamily)